MVLDGCNTHIETDKWEDIRRKLYYPIDVNEYDGSSKPLIDFTFAFLSQLLPNPKKPVKEGYIADLCREGSIAPCALILGLIYIQRIVHTNPRYRNNILPSDLFLTAMIIASKYLQDEGECEALVNSEWSTIGQKEKGSVDILEKEFLNAIDWNLYVTNSEFDLFTNFIQGRIAYNEATRRGWWSYTDLLCYWTTTNTTNTMINTTSQTTKIISGSIATYLLCVTAIVSASQLTATDTNNTTLTLVADKDIINNGFLFVTKAGSTVNTENNLYYTMFGTDDPGPHSYHDFGPHPYHDFGPHPYHDFHHDSGPHPHHDSGTCPNWTRITKSEITKPQHTMATSKPNPFHTAAKDKPNPFHSTGQPETTNNELLWQRPLITSNKTINGSLAGELYSIIFCKQQQQQFLDNTIHDGDNNNSWYWSSIW